MRGGPEKNPVLKSISALPAMPRQLWGGRQLFPTPTPSPEVTSRRGEGWLRPVPLPRRSERQAAWQQSIPIQARQPPGPARPTPRAPRGHPRLRHTY